MSAPGPEFSYTAFAGFIEPAYTQVPDIILDQMMADLGEAELKVLLYIVRRTLGFKKQRDMISLDQLVHGIRRTDGEQLDRGTGLSRSAVRRGITDLLARRLIIAYQNMDPYRGQTPTTYGLRWAGQGENPQAKEACPSADRGDARQRTGGMPVSGQGAYSAVGRGGARQRTPQETDGQETVEQETEPSKFSKTSKRQPPSEQAMGRREHGGLGMPETGDTSSRDHSPQEAQNQPLAQGRPQLRLDPAYCALVDPMTAIGRELGDEAPARSSITRAYRLMGAAGIAPAEFPDLLGEAKALTRAHQAQITKRRADAGTAPRKNLMAYFFATLESLISSDQHPPRQIGLAGTPRTEAPQRLTRGPTTAPPAEPTDGVTKYTSGRYGHLVEL